MRLSPLVPGVSQVEGTCLSPFLDSVQFHRDSGCGRGRLLLRRWLPLLLLLLLLLYLLVMPLLLSLLPLLPVLLLGWWCC